MTVKKTFTLAYQNHKKNNFKNAENLYKEVLKTDPNHFEANFLLGTLSMQIKKFDNAKQLLQKAIKIQPNNPDAHYNLGCVFKELGQLDKAIVYFDKVLNIKTDYIEAYFNRGITKNLQKGKIPFDQQKVLDQCLAEILKNNYDQSLEKLHYLCTHSPFGTQQYVMVFINFWCKKIVEMLNNKLFDLASLRIRSLYMLVIYNKTFDETIQNYFDQIKKDNFYKKLENYDMAVHLSMQSQYFFKKAQHTEAEKCAIQCINKVKILLKNNIQNSDGWLLIKKSLKNIKDPKKAKIILEQTLQNIER
jgi:tetratricopeptide (TPR) repeat protein